MNRLLDSLDAWALRTRDLLFRALMIQLVLVLVLAAWLHLARRVL